MKYIPAGIFEPQKKIDHLKATHTVSQIYDVYIIFVFSVEYITCNKIIKIIKIIKISKILYDFQHLKYVSI